MPQGHRDSTPPVPAATAPDLAVVRLHGDSDKWDSKDIHERFGYRYSEAELKEWALKVSGLARDAADTHVLFNNCYRDYAQVNAQQLAALLRSDHPSSGSAACRNRDQESHAATTQCLGGGYLPDLRVCVDITARSFASGTLSTSAGRARLSGFSQVVVMQRSNYRPLRDALSMATARYDEFSLVLPPV
jgi:Protein of unknown function DUF72